MRTPPDTATSRSRKIAQFATNLVARALIGAVLALPEKTRGPVMGWIMSRLVGPLAGYQKRARAHVGFIFPNLPRQEQHRIATASLASAGRTLIENYAPATLLARQKEAPVRGPGLDALKTAARSGRPVLLVSGHFGNYEALRAALIGRGYSVGGLYRDMSNPHFNAHYVETIKALGAPVFAQGPKGTAGFVRHLKDGGQLVLLFDQHVAGAPALDFLGHPACTALSAAELALKYDAVLLPFFGIRNKDGQTFDCIIEAPVPHTKPEEMMQALNDSLGARIRAHPEQWFWVARRWRSGRAI